MSSGDDQAYRIDKGPFRVEHLRPKDRYELSDGHSFYCHPTSGDGARGAVAGGEVLDSDPDVEASGFDAGYAQGSDTLWAPDISVGNVPDEPGWIKGAPLLGVEYAGVGQDEAKLQRKIIQLLNAGTKYIWVVRLVGDRRVEVYEKGKAPVTKGPGGELTAPGVLRNPVPVEALYDRSKAQEITLRNLLQRKGYEGLDAVRDEGREQGRDEGQRKLLLKQLEIRFGELPDSAIRRLDEADRPTLVLWAERVLTAESIDEVMRNRYPSAP